MRRLLAILAASGTLLASPLAAQDVAVINATVATGDGSAPMTGATVIISKGKVAAVGTEVRPAPNIPTIDGTGLWVTPGLVAAITDLGLYDVGNVAASEDGSASKARFNAALDIAPAINPSAQAIAVARNAGITRSLVAPSFGGSLFAGQGAMIDLGADPDAVQSARLFQLADLGETGADKAGGSRSAAHVELRNALREAGEFAAARWSGDGNLLTRADAEALVPVVTGKQKLFIGAERASDIRVVLGLKRQYPKLDIVLVGASEGWLVAGEIAASGIPVIADSIEDLPDRFEQLAATQSNVGRMVAAGVTVALGRLDRGNNDQPRNIAQFAGNLVALTRLPSATGIGWAQALAAITSVPAEIAGMGGKIGVLRPGAAGDLVLWDGDPLEVTSAPVKVFIDGVEQPVDGHQVRLRERYRDLDESDLPKAYDW